jgi:phosphoglucosamine mutase
VAGAGALRGLTVVVDCANGAMSAVAPGVLRTLGAVVVAMNDTPDGRNINNACGAAYPKPLASRVSAEGADLGLAFDGDGDRVVAVDRTGRVIDGDTIMAIAAVDLADRGLLRNRQVAVTVMTNLGFHRAMESAGIGTVVTPVGDRSVLAAMDEHDLVLGGEQSGHIIHRAHATTGDGLLAAIILCEYLRRSGRSLEDAATVMHQFPQVLVNVRTDEPVQNPAAAIEEEIVAREKELGGNGRILVRASGTEALVRVMVEAQSENEAVRVAGELAAAIVSRFGGHLEGSH